MNTIIASLVAIPALAMKELELKSGVEIRSDIEFIN
jgi:hypothetical protein